MYCPLAKLVMIHSVVFTLGCTHTYTHKYTNTKRHTHAGDYVCMSKNDKIPQMTNKQLCSSISKYHTSLALQDVQESPSYRLSLSEVLRIS